MAPKFLPSIPASWKKFMRRRGFSFLSSSPASSSSTSTSSCRWGSFWLVNGTPDNQEDLADQQQVILSHFVGLLCFGLSTLTFVTLLISLPMALPRLQDALLPAKTAQIRMKYEAMGREVQKLKEQLMRMRRQSEDDEDMEEADENGQNAIQLPSGYLPFPFQKFRVKGGTKNAGKTASINDEETDESNDAADDAYDEENYMDTDENGRHMDEKQQQQQMMAAMRRRAFADELLYQLFKAIPKSGIKMMMNGGNMLQQRGMPKNGRNSLHSGAGGKRPPIVLPTRERTKNTETDTKASIKFDDEKMMMAMVWKRVEMMSECRGIAGEAGLDGGDGSPGVPGTDGAPGEDFPFTGPLFMFQNGREMVAQDSAVYGNNCNEMCPPGPAGQMGEPGEMGDEGEPGARGENGNAGAICVGETGDQGPPGSRGIPGKRGQSGPNGGPKGQQGPPGRPGLPGPPGLPGFPGIPSMAQPGQMGDDGPDGEKGAGGPSGSAGEIGQPGMDGGVCPCESSMISGRYLFKPIIIHRLTNETNAMAIKMLQMERMAKQQKREEIGDQNESEADKHDDNNEWMVQNVIQN